MKPWATLLLLASVGAAMVCALIFMPASELMPAQVQEGSWQPGLSPVNNYAIMQAYKGVAESLGAKFEGSENLQHLMTAPMHSGIPGEVRAYVFYAIFLSAAMIISAIGINAVGRWESEEKTVIPTKK